MICHDRMQRPARTPGSQNLWQCVGIHQQDPIFLIRQSKEGGERPLLIDSGPVPLTDKVLDLVGCNLPTAVKIEKCRRDGLNVRHELSFLCAPA